MPDIFCQSSENPRCQASTISSEIRLIRHGPPRGMAYAITKAMTKVLPYTEPHSTDASEAQNICPPDPTTGSYPNRPTPMTSTKRFLIATGAAAATFALLFFACQQMRALTDFPSGFALIPFYLIFPAYVVAEVLGSRAAFLMTGFLEFFLLWWLTLLAWGRMQPRKGS